MKKIEKATSKMLRGKLKSKKLPLVSIHRIRDSAISLFAFLLISCSTHESVNVNTCSMVLRFNSSILLKEAYLYEHPSRKAKLVVQVISNYQENKSIELEKIEYLDEKGASRHIDRKVDYDCVIQLLDSSNAVRDSYHFELKGSLKKCENFAVEPMK